MTYVIKRNFERENDIPNRSTPTGTPKIKESQTIVQVWRTQNTEFLSNKYMYRCPFLKTCSLLGKINMYKDFIYIFIECYHFRQVNGKALMVYIRYNVSIELLTLYWKVQNRKVDRDFEGEGNGITKRKVTIFNL